MTSKQQHAIYAVSEAILETIQECGKCGGAIEGHMYAALMGKLSLSNFQAILGGLEGLGFIKRANFVCTITEKGEEYLKNRKAA